MLAPQNPSILGSRSPSPPRKQTSTTRNIYLGLGALIVSCFAYRGFAKSVERQHAPSSDNPNRTDIRLVATDERRTEIPRLSPADCERALHNALRLIPGFAVEPEPRQTCIKSGQWSLEHAAAFRCVGNAESVAEIQLCGGEWTQIVADIMSKNRTVPTTRDRNVTSVASGLGLGPQGTQHLGAIARAYSVDAQAVGDLAAKSSEICLGGMDRVSDQPSLAVSKLSGALEFVAAVIQKRNNNRRIAIEELFVAYVSMGCPNPSLR